jgi:hypothetical protein
MTPGASDVDSSRDAIVVPPLRRERVVVRRRRSRSRPKPGTWTARASRRRTVRVFVVCAGVLVLMGVGLYFGLSRQEIPPVEGALLAPAGLATAAAG